MIMIYNPSSFSSILTDYNRVFIELYRKCVLNNTHYTTHVLHILGRFDVYISSAEIWI